MMAGRHLVLLIAAAWLAAVSPARADSGPVDPAKIIGTYQGQAMSGGVVVDVITTFSFDKSDLLVGTYRFREGDEWLDGTLTKARLSDHGDVSFIWQDAFGAGTLTITFADDHQSFTGSWSGLEDTSDAFPWTGKKIK